MVNDAFKQLFIRDLNRLKREIQSYKNDQVLWTVEKAIKNSGGNLCLHIIGNLKSYLGNQLGKTGYVRDRVFEFSGRMEDRNKMLGEIDETIEIVNNVFDSITEEELSGVFPIIIWDKPTPMVFTLIHLYGHFNYHLGQINYHRRLLD
jgi:hypothetical protein